MKYFYPSGKGPHSDPFTIPLLDQLPSGYNSAAIILFPFVKMPEDWNPKNKKSAYPMNYYPTKEDILKYGIPVTLEEIRKKSGLKNIAEVSKAVHAYLTNSSGREIYQRPDLVTPVDDAIGSTIFYPDFDKFACLIIPDILKVLSSNGAKRVKYASLHEETGLFDIKDIQNEDIITLCSDINTIADENEDFVFTIFFDDPSCLFYTRENSREALKGMNLEGVIADEKTTLVWEDGSYSLL